MASLRCYWWYVSRLSEKHTRSHRNFCTASCSNRRIYYMLTHKPHKGIKCFLFSFTKKEKKKGNSLGKALSSSPFTVSKPFFFSGLEPLSLRSWFLPRWTVTSFGAGWGTPGKGAPTQGKSGQRENPHLIVLNSKYLVPPEWVLPKIAPTVNLKPDLTGATGARDTSTDNWPSAVSAPWCSNEDASKLSSACELLFSAASSVTAWRSSNFPK